MLMELSRKQVEYTELAETKEDADKRMGVDMDVEMREVDQVVDEDESEAVRMAQLSISADKVVRAPGTRMLARAVGARAASNRFKVANNQVHQRVRKFDIDKMADDRRGGGGYNRKRRYNRGTAPQPCVLLLCCRES